MTSVTPPLTFGGKVDTAERTEMDWSVREKEKCGVLYSK